MAEAGSRYFCHQCSAEITPKLPDFTCEQCGSGFIEEIDHGEDRNGSSTSHVRDPAADFHDLWGRLFFESFMRPPDLPRPQRTPESSDNRRTAPNDNENDNGDLGGVSERPADAAQSTSTGRPVMFSHHIQLPRIGQGLPGGRPSSVELILQQILGGFGSNPVIIGGGGSPHLHANPGDYAWGPGGLDSIISQLLNQLEGSGPPPADQSRIDALPTVHISQSQKDADIQCSVCFEHFTLNEETKKLPCNHHFHEECILPWLKLHGTCPVCRKDLNGVDTTTQDTFSNTTEPSFSSSPSRPPDNLDEYD